MWSNPCPRKRYVVIVFRCKNSSQNRFADREELHRMQRRNTPTIACGLSDKKTSITMWSKIDQITWSNYVVGAENCISFLLPRVLYCNSSSSGCQGRFEIKIRTQNLIRSKQRKSLVAIISIIKALTVCTHMMEMIAFCFQEYQNVCQHSKIDMQ